RAPRSPPRRPGLSVSLSRRERRQASVPRPGGIRVDAALLHLRLQAPEELTGVLQRRLQLLFAALPQPPEEPELAVVDAEVDLAGHRRRPGEEAGAEQLAQGHRVVVARNRGKEALVEVDRLELDLAG